MGATMEAELTVAKPWWKSRTIWAQLLPLVVAILALLADDQLLSNHPQAVAGLFLAIGVINIVLRSITGQPLTRGKQL